MTGDFLTSSECSWLRTGAENYEGAQPFIVCAKAPTSDAEVERLFRHRVIKPSPGAKGRLLKGDLEDGLRPATEVRLLADPELQESFAL